MKILYVARKYDYGRPERGYSPQHYNFYDTLIKMNNGSNKVSYFPEDEIIMKFGKEEMNKKLLETTYQEKPDLVFFCNGGGAIEKKIIKKISQKEGIVTFNWFCDDHWRFEKYSKYIAPYFNWVATTDSKAPAKYYRIGYKNIIKTQWACNHFLYKSFDLPKIYDVTFVGHPHGERRKIIKKIKKASINVQCWGSGWPNGRISQEGMIKLFSQSKINLNFAKSSGVLWKELASIFFHRDYKRAVKINNPKYWLDNLKSLPPSIWSRQIKGRNFEIPGCSSFFLTEHADDLENYYQVGKEIDCFNSIPELIEKIKYYLTHEREREAIASAGYERTLREHTFEKRFNEIFKIMGLVKENGFN